MKNLLIALCASAFLLASCTGTATTTTSGSGTTTAAPLKTFTMAEVDTHQTAEDCYGVIDGIVYNLTDWISRHPAGPEPIISICGTDVSNFQHPGTSFQAMKGRMQKYQIGTIQE